MNTLPESIPVSEPPPKPGWLFELGWFFAGAVLPIGSLSFYRRSSYRRVGIAILFFLTFTIFIAFLNTIAIGIELQDGARFIRSQFDRGAFPEITIRNGVAEVSGQQPYVFTTDDPTNGPLFYGIDTTGQINTIDRTRYAQGMLLTRTRLIILNRGQLQALPLSAVNDIFKRDPLILNAETAVNAWRALTAIITLFAFLFFVFWNAILRLMVITLAALLLWGIASLFLPKVGFGPFVITGLYALIPAIYLTQLFHRTGVSFLGLQTLLILAFWAVALAGTFLNYRFFSMEIPPRLWTALIGLPFLGMMVVDIFLPAPGPAWVVALWAIALITGLLLVGVRLFFHIRTMQPIAPVQPASMA